MAKRYFIEPIEKSANWVYCPRLQENVCIPFTCSLEKQVALSGEKTKPNCEHFKGGGKDTNGIYLTCSFDDIDTGILIKSEG